MAAVTEYDFVDGDRFFLVAIGERELTDRSETTEWIASTIQVRRLDADELSFSAPLEHTSVAVAPPDGVEPKAWSPDGMGATLQVPAEWKEEASPPVGYDHAIRPPGGGPTVMIARISSGDAADREDFLEKNGAAIESALNTTADGHRARAVRH